MESLLLTDLRILRCYPYSEWNQLLLAPIHHVGIGGSGCCVYKPAIAAPSLTVKTLPSCVFVVSEACLNLREVMMLPPVMLT